MSLKTKAFPKDNNRLISKGNVNNYEMENLNCWLDIYYSSFQEKQCPEHNKKSINKEFTFSPAIALRRLSL